MKCPSCNENLLMSERNGVEIDYCPECRGVWLDRGEIDKIIDGSDRERSNNKYSENDESGHDNYNNHNSNNNRSGLKKKRGGFFGDLMDFGGD